MPALANEPWAGYAKIELVEALGDRFFSCTIDDVDPTDAASNGDRPTFAGDPGSSVTLRFEWAVQNTPTNPVPSQVIVRTMLPGGAQVGQAWSFNPGGAASGVQTTTLHFDSDPLNGTLQLLRSGMLELHFQLISNDAVNPYNIDTRGTVTDAPLGTFSWARGQLTSWFIPSSESISNVSLGGTEPNPFAYPDSIFMRTVLTADAYEAVAITGDVINNTTAAVIRTKAGTSQTGPTRDWSWTAAAEKVDADFAAGLNWYGLQMKFVTTKFGTYDKAMWKPSAGGIGGSNWSNGADYITAQAFSQLQVNPDITLSEVTNPDGNGFLYNRNERLPLAGSATVKVTNARGEGFSPRGTQSLTLLDDGTDAAETAFVIDSHNTTTGVISAHINNIGATVVAPADTVGASKQLRWRDSQADSPAPADSAQVGKVSRLLTLGSLVNPDGDTTVYNRGESVNGVTVNLLAARGTVFTAPLTEVWQTYDVGTAAAEATINVASHNHTTTGAHSLNVTFGTGNVAALDTAGSEKKVRYSDSSGNDPAISARLGYLSRLYDFADHMQLNNSTLNPALDTDTRLVSDLAFVSAKITNRRGQAVNGAVGALSLQDDASLVAALVFSSLTTAAQNANDGYVPLQTWDSSLPGGGWDLWPSTQFTKNGNTTNYARLGAGSSNLTLKAPDPKYGFTLSGGPTDRSIHFVAGKEFQAGFSVLNGETGMLVAVDATSRVAIGRLQNSGANIGRAEYLDPDDVATWRYFDRVTALESFSFTHPTHPLHETRTDSGVYIVNFTAADTAAWGDYDIFVVCFIDIAGVRYTRSDKELVVANINNHDKYRFDPTGLFK